MVSRSRRSACHFGPYSLNYGRFCISFSLLTITRIGDITQVIGNLTYFVISHFFLSVFVEWVLCTRHFSFYLFSLNLCITEMKLKKKVKKHLNIKFIFCVQYYQIFGSWTGTRAVRSIWLERYKIPGVLIISSTFISHCECNK